MEKQPNYALLLPLEKIALNRVVIMLWNQTDVLTQFEVGGDSYSYDSDSRNVSVSSLIGGIQLVENKLSKLVLPQLLLKKFKPVIKWVGLQIQNWGNFHAEFLGYPLSDFERRNSDYLGTDINFGGGILEKLSWTPEGTINYRKTAEEIIRLEMLDFSSLMKLACLYCLEEFIHILRQKRPGDVKVYLADDLYIRQSDLEAFWFNFLLEEESDVFDTEEPFNLFLHAFQKSVRTGNRAAAEYFYQKLTFEEREVLLSVAARDVIAKEDICLMGGPYELPEENYADVLCYLLSQMNTKQQMKLIKENPTGVLSCFFEWPWQDLFFDIAELTWDFFSMDDIYEFLEVINGDLFPEFFLRSPGKFQKFFVEKECLDGYVLLQFFYDGYKDTITFMFRNVDTTTKARLAFCDQLFIMYRHLIKYNEWYSLKLFLREAMISKEERVRLKESLVPFFSEIYEGEECVSKILEWERFFQSFDTSDDAPDSIHLLPPEA